MSRRARAVAPALAVLAAVAPGFPGATAGAAPARPAATDWTWALPPGFPVPRVPANNPMSKAKVALGRFLFYDPRLSGNGTQSCASCHLQARAFTDGRAQGLGSTGELHPRGPQSLANVAYNSTLTWANPSLVRLERQMETPLFGEHPVEMGVNDRNKARVLARFRRSKAYRARYAAAFPRTRRPVTWANTVKAIAAFQRTLISGDSRYDRMLRGTARFTASEKRGAELFFGERAECHHCHGGFNFTEQTTYVGARSERPVFRNTGLFNIGGTGAFPEPNTGAFSITGNPADMGAFRAPTLRNIALTAPYMHDGSVPTLEAVIDFYAAGGRVITDGPNAGDGRVSPFRDPLTSGIELSPQEKADLVAFLGTLTDRGFVTRRSISDPFRRR